jgi:L-alanine-DL-glutamate epimerase-like enolase superfamily enzyme
MATAHWASTIRDFLACETIVGKRDWMDDVIVHDGLVIQGGFVTPSDRPGLGLELNPEVVKAHVAGGEKYWA